MKKLLILFILAGCSPTLVLEEFSCPGELISQLETLQEACRIAKPVAQKGISALNSEDASN